MKYLLFFVGLAVSLAAAILPTTVIKTDALISDMVVSDGNIYAATDGAGVNIFDTKNFKKIDSIRVPDIKNSDGKSFSPKVYSVDHYANATVMVTDNAAEILEIFI